MTATQDGHSLAIVTRLWLAWRLRYARLRLLAVLVAMLVTLALLIGGWRGGIAIERSLYDFRLRYASIPQMERRTVVVDIDESSLRAVGPWPWPRQTTAQLIETLFEHYGVAMVALDIVFPEARPGDDRLRDVFSRYPVIAAEVLDEAKDSRLRLGFLAPGIEVAGSRPSPRANGYIANASSLAVEHQPVGHITPSFDSDGVVRRIKPILCLDGQCLPSLSLRLFMSLLGATRLDYDEGFFRQLRLKLEPDTGVAIPLDAEGQLLIPWNLDSDHIYAVPARDILEQRQINDSIKNTIVIIGSTAFGFGDRVAAPNRAVAPGLEVHLQLLSAFLDDRVPHMLPMPAQLLLVLLLALVLPAFTGREAGILRLLAMSLGLAIFLLAVDSLTWHFGALIMPTAWLLILIALSFLLLAPLEARVLRKAFQQFQKKINMFIPESVTSRLSDPEASSGFDPRSCSISVLFADIRGFTAALEDLSPNKAALLANRLLAEMSSVVARHGGTVEKFTGDGLMSIWEDKLANHAESAVICGIALRQSIFRGLRDWLVENEFPPLDMVVGINSGVAAVGVYGSEARMAYSAHGDVVNVAQRLEMLTRETGEPLLMGESTAHAIGDENARWVGEFSVKGRSGKVRAYAPAEEWLARLTTRACSQT